MVKNNLMKNVGSLLSSSVVTAMLSFALGVFSRRYLTPYEYGVWLTVSLIYIYGAILQLGVINAMNQLVPRLHTQSDSDDLRMLIQNVMKWLKAVFIISILIGIAILICSHSGDKYLIILVIIYTPLQLFYLYYTTLFSSLCQFSLVSKVQVINSLINVVVTMGLIIRLKVFAFVIGLIVSAIISIFIYFLNRRKIEDLPTSKNEETGKFIKYIINLVKLGFPLLIISLSWTFFTSIDRIFVSSFMGARNLGLYSLAIFMFQSLMILPQSFARVIYPKLNAQYSSSLDKTQLVASVLNYSTIIKYMVGFIFGISYIILPLLAHLVFPQYIEGIQAARSILYGISFLSLVWVFIVAFNSINMQRAVLLTILITVLLTILLNSLFLRWGINGVSIATSISGFTYFFIISLLFFKVTNLDIRSIGTYYTKTLLFFVAIFLLTFMIARYCMNVVSIVLFVLIYSITLLLMNLGWLKQYLGKRSSYEN